MSDSEAEQGGLSHGEKRQNVLQLAFGDDEEKFDAFCTAIREIVPEGTRVVLRGSAVTGNGSASVTQNTTIIARIAARRCAGAGTGSGASRSAIRTQGPSHSPIARRRALNCSSAGE